MKTMDERHDGTRYPNHDAQKAFLADMTDCRNKTGAGFGYNTTIGDLICAVLAPSPIEQGDNEPENWQSLEGAFILQTAAELRALAIALDVQESRNAGVDICAPFSGDDAKRMLTGIARRMEAGAELCDRLRMARWGHPTFGGGENWEARRDASEQEAEAAE
jgi:hypothetical protein